MPFQKNNKINLKRKHSPETRKKISNTLKKTSSLIGNSIHKGKKLTEEHKRKISVANSGKNNGSWKNGISKNRDFYRRKYRGLKNENGGFHNNGEWELLKAQYNWICPCCLKKEPLIKLTRDHIIPISKGGSDNIENIQPLCKSCNSKKHDKIISKYVIIN